MKVSQLQQMLGENELGNCAIFGLADPTVNSQADGKVRHSDARPRRDPPSHLVILAYATCLTAGFLRSELGMMSARQTRKGTAKDAKSATMKSDNTANAVAEDIVDAAIKLHRALRPGLLESAYQSCLGTSCATPSIWSNVRLRCLLSWRACTEGGVPHRHVHGPIGASGR